MDPSVVYEAILPSLAGLNKSFFVFDEKEGSFFGGDDGDIQCVVSCLDGDFPMEITLSSLEDIFENLISEDDIIRDFTYRTQSLCIHGARLGGPWIAVRNGELFGILRSEYNLHGDELLKKSNIEAFSETGEPAGHGRDRGAAGSRVA